MDLTNYRSARDGARMVARGVGEGDGYGGYRTRLVAELAGQGDPGPRGAPGDGQVPRHLFVPESVRHRAYEDSALPIGAGQTISQPWVQARYLELARLPGAEKVLEVGTGSGYQTALLALLAEQVFSVERIPTLANSRPTDPGARPGIRNVSVLVGDGTLGWRPFAPLRRDPGRRRLARVPAAAGEQLAPGGRLIIPLGDRHAQVLTLVTREGRGHSQSRRLERRPVRSAARPVRLRRAAARTHESPDGSAERLHRSLPAPRPHLSEVIQHYGTGTHCILFLIIFCETGLVVTPFLPGRLAAVRGRDICRAGRSGSWLWSSRLLARRLDPGRLHPITGSGDSSDRGLRGRDAGCSSRPHLLKTRGVLRAARTQDHHSCPLPSRSSGPSRHSWPAWGDALPAFLT